MSWYPSRSFLSSVLLPGVFGMVAAFGSSLTAAGAPELVVDLNATLASSTPGPFVTIAGITYFPAASPGNGIELWKTDGSAAGTTQIADLNPGAASSAPTQLMAYAGRLFFVANNGSYGPELWSTDGTAAGTQVVKDLRSGATGGSLSALTVCNGALFFAANDGVTGTELWKTDGTAAGTVLVKDLNPGAGNSVPTLLTAVGTRLYLVADDGSTGAELWTSDGTTVGTTLVRDLVTGSAGAGLSNLVALGNGVVCVANDGASGTEPWVSDGTAAGTLRLADITPGATGSAPARLTRAGGLVYFAATAPGLGQELWKTDGTAAGTLLVKNIRAGSGNSGPTNLTAVGSTLYFQASDAATGAELWKSDGTAAGTVLVKDLRPGTGASSPAQLAAVGGRLFFTANLAAANTTMWTSDGTTAGTVLVKDIAANAQATSIVAVATNATDSGVYFQANDGISGAELWTSNGTATGTALLRDLWPGTITANPCWFTELNGTLYFQATTAATGAELFASDGTAAGTRLVRAIRSGTAGSTPTQLTKVGNRIFFVANDGVTGNELWVTDGTTGNTTLVSDLNPGVAASSPTNLTAVGNLCCFTANDGVHGIEPWVSDGTATGTLLLKDLNTTAAAASSSPANVVALGSRLIFAANDGVLGVELYTSDGTPAGTTLLKDIRPGSAASAPANLCVLNGAVYCSANNGTNGVELWRTDGTTAGTTMVTDLRPGTGSGLIAMAGSLAVQGDTLLFAGGITTTGYELYASQGTAATTALVASINPGTASSSPGTFTRVGAISYFLADNGTQGRELWRTDGTAAGTALVSDLTPGSASTPIIRPIALATLLCFDIDTPASGIELWSTNGTLAGTAPVADLNPGALDGLPASTIVRPALTIGSKLYFSGDNGATGFELWKLQANAPPTIAVAASATPNPVTGTTTTLSVLGADDGGEAGLTYAWSVIGTPPAAVAFSDQNANSAKNVTASFAAAGDYTFAVTVTDVGGMTVESVPITVTVERVYALTLAPNSMTLALDQAQVFSASMVDQFNAPPDPVISIIWSHVGIGSLDAAGLYHSGPIAGTASVTATAGPLSRSAPVTVFDPNPPPTIVTAAAADPNPTAATTTTLSVSADDVAGESQLIYTWSTVSGPAAVQFDPNGEHRASRCLARLSAIGSYVFAVEVRNPGGRTTVSHVSVAVLATHTLHVSPVTAVVAPNTTRSFTASLRDQFAATTIASPMWSIDSGAGTIDQDGRFLAGPTVTGPLPLTASLGALVATAQIRVASEPPLAHQTQVSTSRGQAVACLLSASDLNLDPLTYTIVDPPQHGTLTGSPPTLLYTPNADYIGQDSLTFRANDGTSASNLGTVTVDIYAQAPPSTPAALGILSLPAACDLYRWQHDADYRAAYLASIEPGRVWQSASGAAGVPQLTAPGPLWLSSPGMSLITLQVQGAANAPVSFTCTGEGQFTANRRNAITVASDANGLASVIFRTPSAGSSPILVASPAAVGRVRLVVEVLP